MTEYSTVETTPIDPVYGTEIVLNCAAGYPVFTTLVFHIKTAVNLFVYLYALCEKTGDEILNSTGEGQQVNLNQY